MRCRIIKEPFTQSGIGASIMARLAALEAADLALGESMGSLANRLNIVETEIDQMQVLPSFTDVSVVTLTSGQAAGTDPFIAANPTRQALKIQPPSNCQLLLAPGSTNSTTLIGGVPNDFDGSNALYVTGLSAGAKLVVWAA